MLFCRFYGRRSGSYGQSLLEGNDDLDYSRILENEQLLEEGTYDICQECEQSNFSPAVDLTPKDRDELKTFRGCKRNQNITWNAKLNPIDVNGCFSNNEIKCCSQGTTGKPTNMQSVRASISQHFFKINWKQIKEDFSNKLINIPDEYVTRTNVENELQDKTKNNTLPKHPNGDCNCNCEAEINSFCRSHKCLLRYRELPNFSNTSENNVQKIVHHHEPILAPIQGICSRIDE